MKTKRKITRRKMLSVMLTMALLITMMPLWGGQKAKAVELTAQGVKYEVKQDSSGNDYICLTGMADNYADFIDGEGALTLPEEIDGKPVKEIGGMLQIDAGKKVVVPATIDTFVGSMGTVYISGSTVEEVDIMCQGLLKPASDSYFGIVYFFGSSLKKINFYPSDFDGVAENILPAVSAWEDYGHEGTLEVHVSSQTVIDKFKANEILQAEMTNGTLVIVKDLDISGDTVLVAKRQVLAQRIAQGKAMAQKDYTKASWEALQAAIADGEKLTESNDESALDAANVALETALNGMVSLEAFNKALDEAVAILEGDTKAYTNTSLLNLQQAINAARLIAEDATAEDVKQLTTRLTNAKKNLQKRTPGKVEIAWEGEDSGPAVPPVKVVSTNISNDSLNCYYYKDEACTTPAAGEDAATRPTEPGEYYLRAVKPGDGSYLAATSNVLKFTITERQVNWNGYQWDAEAREITITEDMPDFPNIMEVPWYDNMMSLLSVKVKEGVTLTRIGSHAFEGAHNVMSFQIPDTVKEVGESAFSGCPYLEATVSLSGITVGANAFKSCGKLQGTVTLVDSMTEIPEGCFSGCSIKGVNIPAGVTSIGKEAFHNSKALEGTDVILPQGLQSIGKSAFEGCGSVEAITIPPSLTELGDRAFASTGLRQIVIPATVQTIGGGQFQGCQNLSYVEIAGKEYGTEALKSEKAGKEGKEYDTMFDQTSSNLEVLCEGTTYDTLASYAGTADQGGSIGLRGWTAGILRKTDEYLAEVQTAYETEKQAIAGLQREDYTEATWNSLQAAIAAAEALLSEGGSTRETIASRQAAQKKLAEGTAVCLREILEGMKAFLAGENIEKDYDTEADSWWDLQDAVEDAGRTLQDSNASATQIIKRIQGLQEAKKNLAPRNPQPGTSATPSTQPGTDPSAKPSTDPGTQPGTDPSAKPSADPGTKPSTGPSAKPSTQPSVKPSASPSAGPNVSPSTKPTAKPQAPKVKKATVKKAKSTKKKTITVQWKKLSGITGYQVQLALDKKFKKGKKTYTVKKAKTTKKTIKKLKRKKKYYVRVRAYKTVKGKKYYGSWSKAKKVKVK